MRETANLGGTASGDSRAPQGLAGEQVRHRTESFALGD